MCLKIWDEETLDIRLIGRPIVYRRSRVGNGPWSDTIRHGNANATRKKETLT